MASKQASVKEAPYLWRFNAYAGDLGLTPEALENLKREGLDLSDVLSVIESPSDFVLQGKESCDGAIKLIGENVDQEFIEITVLLEPDNAACVLGVARR